MIRFNQKNVLLFFFKNTNFGNDRLILAWSDDWALFFWYNTGNE